MSKAVRGTVLLQCRRRKHKGYRDCEEAPHSDGRHVDNLPKMIDVMLLLFVCLPY